MIKKEILRKIIIGFEKSEQSRTEWRRFVLFSEIQTEAKSNEIPMLYIKWWMAKCETMLNYATLAVAMSSQKLTRNFEAVGEELFISHRGSRYLWYGSTHICPHNLHLCPANPSVNTAVLKRSTLRRIIVCNLWKHIYARPSNPIPHARSMRLLTLAMWLFLQLSSS